MKKALWLLPAVVVTAVVYRLAQGQKEIRPHSASRYSRILFENDRVRVSRFRAAPGARAGMLSQPDHVLYPLKGCELRQVAADGKTSLVDLKKGKVAWSRGSDHSLQVAGARSCDFVDVELKEPPAGVRP